MLNSRPFVTVTVAFLVCLTACTTSTASTCVAGATQACVCVGGSSGVQTCNADGKSFAACVCQTPADVAAGADSGDTGSDSALPLDSTGELPGVDILLDSETDAPQSEIPISSAPDDSPFDPTDAEIGGSGCSAVAWGASVGSYRGITAHSNASCTQHCGSQCVDAVCSPAGCSSTTCGIEWQCVEYVERFYHDMWDTLRSEHAFTGGPAVCNMRGSGNASSLYTSSSNPCLNALKHFPNLGKDAPEAGDIITWAPNDACGKNGVCHAGHTAIIRSVGKNAAEQVNAITVIQQNVKQNTCDSALDFAVSVDVDGHYDVATLGSKYITQGWMGLRGGTGPAAPDCGFDAAGNALPSGTYCAANPLLAPCKYAGNPGDLVNLANGAVTFAQACAGGCTVQKSGTADTCAAVCSCSACEKCASGTTCIADPAKDGTTCGSNLACQSGKCVLRQCPSKTPWTLQPN